MTRLVAMLLIAAMPAAAAQLPVFASDPIDPTTGAPYIILPGVPLVNPGPDGRFGNGDDIIDPSIIGDVDLVVRTGGGYAGGPIPAPHAGLAAAPAVVAGGTATGGGTTVAFQGIVSDGQPPFVTGNALTGPELDGRPLLAVAYADLDGDGFIGPTAADGDADDQVERQEILVPAGRAAASIAAGVATGSLALTIAAPASAGGLGVVVTAGASTGTTPFLYFDGPWIATLLPYMPPLDPKRIIGGNGQGGPDPTRLLADFELEFEKVFSPAPNDPVLGTPYAIPLDGSSPTVDLVRSVSGPASGVGFGSPVDVAGFVPDPSRRLLPAVGPTGQRTLLTSLDAVALASDGSGGAVTVDCFPVDRFGNATDPPAGGYAVTVETGPRLRIVSPDTDGDPHSEPLMFASASAIQLVIDDAGLAAPAPVVDHLVAVRNGAPVGALRADLAAGPGGPVGGGGGGGGGGTPAALGHGSITMRFETTRKPARLSVTARFDADGAAVDPGAQGMTINLAAGSTPLYSRTLAAGAMKANRARTSFTFHDPASAGPGHIRRLSVRRHKRTSNWTTQLRVSDVDLATTPPSVTATTATLTVGGSAFAGDLQCTANRKASVTTCVR